MLRFIGTLDKDADIIGLLFRQFRQLHSDFIEVQPGDFFIELLWQAIDGWLVFVASLFMLYLLHRIVSIFWHEEDAAS